ncbi:MAG: hypothetical protein IPP99_08730 [Chitinophagaceae bacterium]|nr:hypothetical protein [Chitinophagaceae bacterium]
MIKAFSIIIFFLTSLLAFGQGKTDVQKRDADFNNATKKWFLAWELVSTQYYKIQKVKAVEFVFFDDQYVYSTSAVTIKNGSPVKGNHLMNLKFQWKRELHHDSLTLPDKSVVPINLMSLLRKFRLRINLFRDAITGLLEAGRRFQQRTGFGKSDYRRFYARVFSFPANAKFWKKMTAFEKETNYGIEFSDDIVQHIFFERHCLFKILQQRDRHLV